MSTSKTRHALRNAAVLAAAGFCLLLAPGAWAAIPGLTGMSFALTAKPAIISTPDGDSLLVWGYGEVGGVMQYPGPTLIVEEGQTISITLVNELGESDMPVSIVFPGQSGVVASGGIMGELTRESHSPTDTVTYTFTAGNAGTYLYNSGTQPELQTEMGMVGALIVRPANAAQAYDHPDTAFDQEYLYVLTEMDPQVHYLASLGLFDSIDNSEYRPVLWFINGRNAPDTIADANVGYLPNQPYNALSRTHPGDTVLARVINAGRDLHPFHTHGNHVKVVGRDGRMLGSSLAAGPDLAHVNFTIQTVPGSTYDALWSWTGDQLGWDIYGHTAGDLLEDGETIDDHGKPLPVVLPALQDLTFGGFYSGSPFLGQFGNLPPGEGGLNLDGGLFFMWHSHTEKELVNNDIAPGGMMTMMIVEHPLVPIP